jgi:hypothetical protein
MAQGKVDQTTIPPSKPEEIDKIGMMKMPMRKPAVMKPETQESLGNLEYEAEVRPEFISPIGLLGLDARRTLIEPQKVPMNIMGSYHSGDDLMRIDDVSSEGLALHNEAAEVLPYYSFDERVHRAIKENPTIEHEAIHRGMQILKDYYTYDEVAKRFDEGTADFLFNKATYGGNLESEVITELNDARRLGLDDYDSFLARYQYLVDKGRYTKDDLELKMAATLTYLPAMEELAKERLYDRNPEGGPTKDARGLARGSLGKSGKNLQNNRSFYRNKMAESKQKFRKSPKSFSEFMGDIRQKFKNFVTRKPDFEETSKQMPKEFNKGGDTMEQQMQMAFMDEGGLKDDGMDKDPVSGNDVPSGSLAEEVRDDIPAQLSEGEYVVPADVVRFFGVKFFEDLRMQAKMGLAQMERTGRIGGEPIAVSIETSEEMLDPEDEKKIREMVKGFNEGGISTDEDFKKDAEAKKFDFAKYSTPGGTLFGPRKPKLEGLITYYHPDGSSENVLYVNGKVANEEQIKFTQPPWSRTKTEVTTPPTGGGVSFDRRDEQTSSNRERDLGGVPVTTPDESFSTEDLARKYGGEALYFDAERTKVVKMPELVYKNLRREYDTLGGAKVFDSKPNAGDGFARYYKVPQTEKLSMLFQNRFGEKPTKEQVQKLLDDSQTKTSFIDAFKNFGLLGILMNLGKGKDSKVVSGVPTSIEPDLTTTEGRLAALRGTRDDRPFTAIDSPIYATAKDEKGDPVFVTDTLTGQKSRKVTADDLRRYQDDIAKGTPLGDTRIGRNVTKFMQGFQTADERKAKEAGVNVGDPVVYGTKADGSQGFKPVTDRTVANMEQNRRDVEEAQQASQDTFMQTGDAGAADRAYHESFTGFDSQGNFLGNEGGLASKPKAKPKRKKNTKGLGTKPKAT